MTQLAERPKAEESQLSLPCCACLTISTLTFHTEFGAASVFVDENKKDEEEDASEACQAHSNGNLGEERPESESGCIQGIIPAWLATTAGPGSCFHPLRHGFSKSEIKVKLFPW